MNAQRVFAVQRIAFDQSFDDDMLGIGELIADSKRGWNGPCSAPHPLARQPEDVPNGVSLVSGTRAG
jgi:hypothetical protein